MIRGERREHWLHRRGDRDSPLGREILSENRICSIPDAAEWEILALAHGRTALSGAPREQAELVSNL